MSDVIATNQTILVVGGGISGMTAAIEAAECGKQVILVEKILCVDKFSPQLFQLLVAAPQGLRANLVFLPLPFRPVIFLTA